MKQEPVAWVDKIWMERPDLVKNYLDIGKLFMRFGEGVENYVPLYTEPQYRELSDEEIMEMYKHVALPFTSYEWVNWVKAILKKASEK